METEEDTSYCPFCSNIPGVGESPAAEPASEFDRVLDIGPEVVLVPVLGMLVPGYLLVISVQHVPNMACLDYEALRALAEYIRETIARLSPLFGEYFVFEHAPSSEDHLIKCGACIGHAHLHLIPSLSEAGDAIFQGLPWTEIRRLTDIRSLKGAGYALFAHDDTVFVSPAPVIPSQWVRHLVAFSVGKPDHWDWAVYQGHRELRETTQRLRLDDD